MSRRFMIYDFDADTLAANERPVLTAKDGLTAREIGMGTYHPGDEA